MGNEVREVEYSGKSFINMVNRYFMYTDNQYRNMSFVEIDPKALFIKIDAADGKKLYKFSKTFHNCVKPQFDLEEDKEYYIWRTDMQLFNAMSEEEQLQYLNTVVVNGHKIGIIDSSEIQNYLRSFIKLNVNYNGLVKESEMIGHYWWHLVGLDNLNLDIYVNHLVKNGYKMKVNVIYDDSKKGADYVLRDVNNAENLLKPLEESNLLTVLQLKNNSAENKYTYYFMVKSTKPIGEADRKITIFNIYLYPNYYSHYYRIRFNKDILQEFNLTDRFSYSGNQFEGSIKEIKDKITTFAEAIKDSEEYRELADALLSI